MRVRAICPASCGELIQGMIMGKEMLISYPVNLYSTAEVWMDRNQAISNEHIKARKAIAYFLSYIGEEKVQAENFHIKIHSSIPKGKGMASSTADIAASVLGAAEILQYPLREEELAKIALQVEPTDSVLFDQLTLFDHLRGTHRETIGRVPKFRILVLEGIGVVETTTFRKNNNYRQHVKSRDAAYQKVRNGIANHNMKLIGEAASESALLNQSLLYKPYLEDLIEMAVHRGAVGVNIAHSGTVCGIIYDDKTDLEKLKKEIGSNYAAYFTNWYSLETVSGGPTIMDQRRG